MKVLVVDDDAGLRRSVCLILEDGGHVARAVGGAAEALRSWKDFGPDLVLTDVRMPGTDGLGFLERFRADGGRAPVVVMTAYGSMELAVEAIRRGAYDYLPKPFGADELLLLLRKAEERDALRREVDRLRDEVDAERRYGDLVAAAPGMVRVVETARKIARHATSLLLQGPTGTGKELLARLVHRESDRADGPFVAVNCGAIPQHLIESEFFGHARGAFTGADRDREGLFEAASGGTLLLDEVGDLPEGLQVKLLRVLQEGEVRRLGEAKDRAVDVRVVAATNRTLVDEVSAGRFREDLYYRLAVVTLDVPALRDRPEDLPLLVRHFLDRHGARLGVSVRGVEPAAMDALAAHPWPGNVRELENVIERALVLAEGDRIRVQDLPPALIGEREREASAEAPPAGAAELAGGRAGVGGGAGGVVESDSGEAGEDLSVKRRGAALERELIRKALERTGGHRTRAAALLELSDRALRYKIRDYGLEDVGRS